VIVPIGFRILTNEADPATRKLVFKYANERLEENVPEEDRISLRQFIEKAENILETANMEEAASISAELNGILKLYDCRRPNGEDFHFLISTDTWLGEATARLVERRLREHFGVSVMMHRQIDLQTAHLETFSSPFPIS